MRGRLRSQKGIAILIAIAFIVTIFAAVVTMNREERSSLTAAAAMRDLTAMQEMARSGVEAARAVLIEGCRKVNSSAISLKWFSPDRVQAVVDLLHFPEGHIEVTVEDETARFPINALVVSPGGRTFDPAHKIALERLLNMKKASLEDPTQVEIEPLIDAIKDWIDTGDDDAITGLGGAESDYYEALTPPYPCPNRPIQDLDEMLLIKGMTPLFFNGTAHTPGLRQFLTVFGRAATNPDPRIPGGRIDIDTAAVPVIAALLRPEYTELAQNIVDYRTQRIAAEDYAALEPAQWYKQAPGCGDLSIDPTLIATASDLFRVHSTAVMGGRRIGVEAILHTEKNPATGKWRCRILRWRFQ